MILCKGKAGLGNRMLAAAGASLFADEIGQPLAIEWRHRTQPDNSFATHFELGPTTTVPELGQAQAWPPAWQGKLTMSVDELLAERYPGDEDADHKAACLQATRVAYKAPPPREHIGVRWGWDAGLEELRGAFPGKFQGADFDVLRAVFARLYQPRPDLAAELSRLRSAWIPDNMLGVHVRYSDRKIAIEPLIRKAQEQLDRRQFAGVFLATDNKMVEDMFKARFKQVATLPKWLPEPGQPIHRSASNPGFMAVERSSLIDMFALSFCSAIVFDSRSTFGLCAALLSHADRQDLHDMRSADKWHAALQVLKRGLRALYP